MKNNHQHIAFDDLLALHGGRLDLQKANQCRNHLDTCEECQNTYEAIQEFNTIKLRQPHLEYAEKELDQNLLNITKQHIKISQKNNYIRNLKCHFYENGWRYLVAVAASLLLIFLFEFIPDTYSRKHPWIWMVDTGIDLEDMKTNNANSISNINEENLTYIFPGNPNDDGVIDSVDYTYLAMWGILDIAQRVVMNGTVQNEIIPKDIKPEYNDVSNILGISDLITEKKLNNNIFGHVSLIIEDTSKINAFEQNDRLAVLRAHEQQTQVLWAPQRTQEYFASLSESKNEIVPHGLSGKIDYISTDITTHELTHGIISEYTTTKGALGESFLDIFGEVVENSILDENDWVFDVDTLCNTNSNFNTNEESLACIFPGSADDNGVVSDTDYLYLATHSGIGVFPRPTSTECVLLQEGYIWNTNTDSIYNDNDIANHQVDQIAIEQNFNLAHNDTHPTFKLKRNLHDSDSGKHIYDLYVKLEQNAPILKHGIAESVVFDELISDTLYFTLSRANTTNQLIDDEPVAIIVVDDLQSGAELESEPIAGGILDITQRIRKLETVAQRGVKVETKERSNDILPIPKLGTFNRYNKYRKRDSLALVAVYNATNGHSWAVKDSITTRGFTWNLYEPINNWKGVTLNDSGRVTGLSLQNNNLAGHIPKEIGNLSELVTLSLIDNDLSGKIPRAINKLSKLTDLHLYANNLSGKIPNLNNLKKLEELHLYANNLSGKIPNLNKLPNLIVLNLDDNQLTGKMKYDLVNSGAKHIQLMNNKLKCNPQVTEEATQNKIAFRISGNKPCLP